LTDRPRAEANHKFLTTFYGVLKHVEDKLAFMLMTGVTRFTRVSLFSELNNLDDITMDDAYAGIAGFTEREVATLLGEINMGRDPQDRSPDS